MTRSRVRPPQARWLSPAALARLANLMLRGSTLGSKFLLVFFLARFLQPFELGMYGLLVAAISYSLYLLGFDFYTYSTRELLARERRDWGQILKSQATLSAVLYILVLPLLLFLFWKGVLPWKLCGWFFLLLVLEHLNQELFRLFVALSQPLRASVLLCLRSGLWAVVVVLVMMAFPSLRNLEAVLTAWALGGVIALVLGGIWLHGLDIHGWFNRVDWQWIAKGLKVAIPLLLATLALRGLSTFDRYWFEYLQGLDTLGAYVLFAGVSAALIGFLDAGVFSFIYPSLIKAWQQQDVLAFSALIRKMFWQTVSLIILFSIFCALFIPSLLPLLGKQLYLDNLDLLPWVLAGTVFFALGLIPHYALYAQNRDKPIIHSHLVGLVVFFVGTSIFSEMTLRLAVPLGVVAAFIVILCWKIWCFYRVTPVQCRSSN